MLDNLHDIPLRKILDHPVWHWQKSLAAWEMYLNGVPGKDAEYYAVPIRTKNLGGLPPAYMMVGDAGLFLDECHLYASRLTDCDINTILRTYPSIYHAAELTAPSVLICKSMIDDYARGLERAF